METSWQKITIRWKGRTKDIRMALPPATRNGETVFSVPFLFPYSQFELSVALLKRRGGQIVHVEITENINSTISFVAKLRSGLIKIGQRKQPIRLAGRTVNPDRRRITITISPA